MRSDNVSEAGGSSPLTRGTRESGRVCYLIARFIPAYAGNSRKSPFTVPPYPVHPRLRGELYRLSKKRFSRHGSSPLTRGTRCDRHQRFNVCRFIPAYAGNSKQQKSEQNATTVHPRLRGELIAVPPFKQSRIGSSPLTRGTRTPVSTGSREPGFIPAYAGNSYANDLRSGIYSVHPRLRGELIGLARRLRRRTGSSPLTRGTPDLIQHYEDHQRFIPAYAGNSQEQRKLPLERPVHPRLRGELFSCSVIDCMSAGSSPLTRGTQQRLSMRSIFRRFIPAYAGNSIS